MRSLQPRGVLRLGVAERRARSRDPDALLALKVNGADLSPDHGYPARIIVPALPGVHNTKWVGRDRVRMRAPLRRIPAAPARPPGRAAARRVGAAADRRPPATRCAILVWLALSAVVHDLVLLPFYGAARPRRAARGAGPAVNYVRVPALLSGLLLLVFFPVISGKGEPSFTRVSGLDLRRLPRALAADHRGAVRASRARVYLRAGARGPEPSPGSRPRRPPAATARRRRPTGCATDGKSRRRRIRRPVVSSASRFAPASVTHSRRRSGVVRRSPTGRPPAP